MQPPTHLGEASRDKRTMVSCESDSDPHQTCFLLASSFYASGDIPSVGSTASDGAVPAYDLMSLGECSLIIVHSPATIELLWLSFQRRGKACCSRLVGSFLNTLRKCAQGESLTHCDH